MTGSFGRWLTIEKYADSSGLTLAEARKKVRTLGLMRKSRAGRDYVWIEDPDSLTGQPEAASEIDPQKPKDRETALEKAKGPIEGEALVSRFSGAQELAMQAERAISLVERSLGTFMMMHQEVVKEKDRSIERAENFYHDSGQKLVEQEDRVTELETQLREKEQEIEDLRMLVEIMEKRTKRPDQTPAAIQARETASVGDLMEDQLRYIMEDQMIKDLLK